MEGSTLLCYDGLSFNNHNFFTLKTNKNLEPTNVKKAPCLCHPKKLAWILMATVSGKTESVGN